MPITNPTTTGTVYPVDTTFPVTRGNTNATESVLVLSGIITTADLDNSPFFMNERGVYVLQGYDYTDAEGDDIVDLDRHLYFDNTADVRQLRNITIDLNGRYMFIHRDRDNTEFMIFDNVFFVNSINHQSDLIDEGGRWQARGGGYIRRVETGNSSRWIQAGSPFSDVLVKSEEYCERGIESLYFNDAGEYRNITAIGVEFLQLGSQRGSESDATRVLMHDSSFASFLAGWQARIIADGNTNFMLNDCEFTNYVDNTINNTNSGWMRTTSQGSVTDKAAYNYFMGTTSSIVRNSWQNAAHNLQRRLFKGSLKYFQIFKDGVPFNDIHYQVYSKSRHPVNNTLSALTARKFIPTTTNDEMLLDLGTSPPTVNGEIDIAVIKTMISYITGQWRSTEYEDIILRLRHPTIGFQDYVINADQALISQGRPDNHVPLVVQTDPHYFDEGIPSVETTTNIALNFTTRTVTIDHNRAITPRELYYYLKNFLVRSGNFIHSQFFSYDGNVLDLGNWNLVFGNNCTLQLLGSSGTEIRCLTGTITLGNNFVNDGVTLIDQNGLTVIITSNAPGTRALINGTSFENIPYTGQLPFNAQVPVVAKADGYLFQKYTVDTATQRRLDIRLPQDPALDLDVTFNAVEKAVMTFTRPEAGHLNISLTEVNLIGQREKSKRILDSHFSTNAGLLFLHEYVDELTGSPLNGSPIVFGNYRITMDVDNNDTDGKIRWLKNAYDTARCRFGAPVFTPGKLPYLAPLISGNGQVVFDNQVLSDANSREIAAEVVDQIDDSTLVADVGTALAPRFNAIDTALGTKPTAAEVWNHTIIEPMDDGQGGMTPAISAETYLDTSIPQTIATSQAAIIAAITGLDLSSLSIPTANEIRDAVWAKIITANPNVNAQNYLISLKADAGILLGRLTDNRANRLDRIDADISSRLATTGYTAPSNTSIATILARVDANVSSIPSSVWTFNLRTSPSNINARSMLDTLHQQYADIIAPYIVRMHTELTADQRQEDVEGNIVNHETVIKKLKDNEASLATVLARLTGDRAGYLDNLTRLDVDISSRLATSGYTAPPAIPAFPTVPTATQIRTEMEKSGTSLALLLARVTSARMAHLDADISSRLATSGYTAPPAAITGFATARAKLAEVKTAIDGKPTAVENRTEMEKIRYKTY